MKQTRTARYFEFGYPYFFGGIEYSWPDGRIDYDGVFRQKRGDITRLLDETAKRYMEEFGLSRTTPSYYPRVMEGDKGITVSLGNGGRFIELWKMPGAYFISGNNLDGYRENAVAFNVGSDVLEAVDETFLAPRIITEGPNWVLRYPLPGGVKKIATLKADERFIKKFYETAGFETEITIEDGELQRVVSPRGIITIQDGVCEGRGFEGWNAARASWIIAKIMSRSSET